jgi:hypothetical protein
VVAVAAGCGGKNPAAPSQAAAPTITGLAVIGADAVLTSLSVSYTVTATLTDGTTRTVTPAWTSSNPGVASVDGVGRLEGRVHGSTNLTASYEGRSATKNVQVVNNYAGTWEGRYVIRACTDAGDLADRDGGWCRDGPGRVGTVGSIRLVLSQTGGGLSDITGTLGVNDGGSKVTGTVTADGRLGLGGSTSIFGDLDFDTRDVILSTLQIMAWESNLAGPGVMTGRWSEHLALFTFRNGTADTDNELVTMTQTSTSAKTASAPR